MLVFIDDSGDPGFKTKKGSSLVFIICCIIFDDELEAEKTAIKINELKRRLKKSDNFEFKFNKCSKKIRTEFLKVVANSKFRIRAIVMPKANIYGAELKNSKESFYNFSIKTVLKYSFGKIKDAKIRLDGHGNRIFRNKLIVYLRKHLNKQNRKIIQDLRFKNSKKDVLIQLSDMVAGTIGRNYQATKTDRTLYWNIIKKRKEDIWVFGNNTKNDPFPSPVVPGTPPYGDSSENGSL